MPGNFYFYFLFLKRCLRTSVNTYSFMCLQDCAIFTYTHRKFLEKWAIDNWYFFFPDSRFVCSGVFSCIIFLKKWSFHIKISNITNLRAGPNAVLLTLENRGKRGRSKQETHNISFQRKQNYANQPWNSLLNFLILWAKTSPLTFFFILA